MRTIAIFLVGVCTIVLSGCATTTLPNGVASAGYTEVVSVPLGPLRYFHTTSVLPGKNAVGATNLVRCTNTARTINLQIANGLALDAADVCARIDAAAAASESWIPAASNRYRILLLPEGTAGAIRTRSLGLFATGRQLAFVAPVYSNQHRTFANLVDLVAHESFHALGHAEKIPEDRTKEAPTTRACARNFGSTASLQKKTYRGPLSRPAIRRYATPRRKPIACAWKPIRCWRTEASGLELHPAT